jgi:hypothetical protein
LLQLAFRNAAATWREKYDVVVTTKPRIAIVIGSTRPGRYAAKAGGWMLKQTKARDDIEAALLEGTIAWRSTAFSSEPVRALSDVLRCVSQSTPYSTGLPPPTVDHFQFPTLRRPYVRI